MATNETEAELIALRHRIARLEELLADLAVGNLMLSNALAEAATATAAETRDKPPSRLAELAGVQPASLFNALKTSAEAFQQAKRVYEELIPHGR